MVAMVGCPKVVNDPRVRVRTRARVFKYLSDHVDHVTLSVSSLSSISYTPTWSGTWSAHGLVCSQSSKESFNTGTKGAMVKTFGIKTQGT